jgi:hypothetical protein
MNEYPTVAFIARHGRILAITIAALGPLAGLAAVAWGLPWPLLAAGIVAGVVLYGLAQSYVEIVRIIWDTLVPK